MLRKQRMYLPDVPAHVALRGNKRGLFFHEDDYRFYFSVSAEVLKRYRVTKEVAIQRAVVQQTISIRRTMSD